MAQDEKMLRLIRELAEKAGCDGWRAEAMCGEIVKVIDQALSAAPAQPAAAPVAYGADHQPWCQPGDQTDRAFRLRFEDPDMREMVWTGPDAEKEALAAYNQYAPTWNVYLFSSHPRAQPAAVEASRKDFVGEGDVVKAGVVYGPLSKDYLIGVLADRDLEIATLRAHPSPPADDVFRVAVEALEDAAHEAHGRGYVQGFADAVWDETGDYDEETLTENLDPEKLRDGWYDDARHTYLDAQTKALAALKAGGVK